MTIESYPSSTIEYVRTSVSGNYTTSMPVHMAITPCSIKPSTNDWHTAQWDSGYAKVKIGAGTDIGQLAEGVYGVWVKITASDETPVIDAGPIRIT